jgi:hypothetical protein
MGDSGFPQAIERSYPRERELVKTRAGRKESSVNDMTFHRQRESLDGTQLLLCGGV